MSGDLHVWPNGHLYIGMSIWMSGELPEEPVEGQSEYISGCLNARRDTCLKVCLNVFMEICMEICMEIRLDVWRFVWWACRDACLKSRLKANLKTLPYV